MRRGLVRGWSELGARTADCWRDYNKRFFGGRLMPLPMFFVHASPYGRWVGLTFTQLSSDSSSMSGWLATCR